MAVAAKNALTALTATEMARRIREGEVSSADLVEAHIERIQHVNGDLNALVVSLFAEARAAARQADDMLAAGESIGPLHGVPVTVKEFFDVAGCLTTAGIESGGKPAAQTDAPTVSRLRQAGAIILGKSNVPQLGIAIETDNPVYGRTNNPWDLDRSPGGSSGGEAALIAAGASPLGLGSDGGGSIRVPSHFSGVCGIKPTSNRLTMHGHWQFPAFPAGWSQPGPMARSVHDLQLALDCLVARGGEPSDPSIAPGHVARLEDVELGGLKIGFYCSEKTFPTSPAVRRACEQAVAALRPVVDSVAEFEAPDPMDVWEIQLGQFCADGGKWMRRVLGKSAVDPRIKKALLNASLPTAVRRALPAVLDSMGQGTLAEILRRSKKKTLSAYAFQETLQKQQSFRQGFLRRMDEQQLDALICPPFPTVAMKHLSPDIVLAIGYTQTYNLLGNPAGVVPITTVQQGEESARDVTKDDTVRDLARAEQASVGMPVGVQVVARHWREDVVLAIMNHLQIKLRENADYPHTPTL